MASLPLTTLWVRPAWSHYILEADSLMSYQGLFDYLRAFRGETIERNPLLEAAARGDGDVDAVLVLAIRMDQTFRLHYERILSDRDFTMFFWKLGTYFNFFHQGVHPWGQVVRHTANYEWFPPQHLNVLKTYPNLERQVPIRAEVLTEATQVLPPHPSDIEVIPVQEGHAQTPSNNHVHDRRFSFHIKETCGDRIKEFSIDAPSTELATDFDNNHSEEDRKTLRLRHEEDRETLRLKHEMDLARLEKERQNEDARQMSQLEIAKLNLLAVQVQSGQNPSMEGHAHMYRHENPLSNLVSPTAQTPCRNKRSFVQETSTAKKKAIETPMPRPGINKFEPSDIAFDHLPGSHEIQTALGALCPQSCSFTAKKGSRIIQTLHYETRVMECGCKGLAEANTCEKIPFCCKVRIVYIPKEGVYYVQASGIEEFKYHVTLEGKQIIHLTA